MTSIAAGIRDAWTSWGHTPSLAEVHCAATLATHHHLIVVRRLRLHDMDLDTIPVLDLGNLSQCVSDTLFIDHANGDLSPILSNIRCRWLYIDNMSHSTTYTRSLVTAMDTGVKNVVLGEWSECGGVAVDMETLGGYNGRGVCGCVRLWDETKTRYRNQVTVWAENIGWHTVAEDDLEDFIQLERN